MFGVSSRYIVGKSFPKKDIVPKDIKPETKKKLKEHVVNLTLSAQIIGEEIASVINAEYNYQAIQYFTIEIIDIKHASSVANAYQNSIKSPCILRLHDSKSEVYSFALKRLNQNDNEEIVITDKLLTKICPLALSNDNEFLQELDFLKILNKADKVSFYTETFVKAFILANDKLYSNIKSFLTKPLWYDRKKVTELYSLFCKLSQQKEKLVKAISNAEKMGINLEIKKIINELEKM